MPVTRGATASRSVTTAETGSPASMVEDEMPSAPEEEDRVVDVTADSEAEEAEEYQAAGEEEEDEPLEADPLPKTKRSRKEAFTAASRKGGKPSRRGTASLGMPPRYRLAKPLPPRVELPSADLLAPLTFPKRHNATEKLETALSALTDTQDYVDKLQESYEFCLDTAERIIESYEEKLEEFEEYSTAVFSDLTQLRVDAATKEANNKSLEAGNRAHKTEISLLKKNVARQDQIIKKLNQELKEAKKTTQKVDDISVAKAKADIAVDAQRRKLLNQDHAKTASKKRSEQEKSNRLQELKRMNQQNAGGSGTFTAMMRSVSSLLIRSPL